MRNHKPEKNGLFTRRQFLHLSGMIATTGLVTACVAAPPEEGVVQAPAAVPAAGETGGKEAPALAQRVAQGDLPPLDERLPRNPLVVEPVEQIGTYGGDWNDAMTGTWAGANLIHTLGYDLLVRWKPDVRSFSIEEVIPNVAESFEINEDGAEYVFRLREGMKWSDGEPFTADDLMFWYEDVLMNEALTPAIPSWLSVGEEPLVVEKQDDYTVVFRFSVPNGFFLQNLARPWGGYDLTRFPRHYMEQFHEAYNPEAGALAEAAGFDDWVAYFTHKAVPWENHELPVLWGWYLTTAFGATTQQMVAERNPYYWKVDPEGKQLPYLDRVVYSIVQDDSVMLLRAVNGDIDIAGGELRDKTLFVENQEEGDYHFYETIPAGMNYMMIALNLTHQDPVKREVYQNKDFRIGLSHAINRQEIIDTVFVSQGEPWQGAPRPESPLHNETLAKQYTEYDVELANEYLDRVLPERNSEGMRLGPDGEPFVVVIETRPYPFGGIDPLELVQTYWNAVGVETEIEELSGSLWSVRKDGNLLDATAWPGEGGLDVFLLPRSYFPSHTWSLYAVPWANWYLMGGLSGNLPEGLETPIEEPPPAAKRQMELFEQIKMTTDAEEQIELMEQILQIAQEEFWEMGIVLWPTGYGIVKNDVHNVPESFIVGVNTGSLGRRQPQHFFKE